jgi:hypothetical protein
VRLFGKLALARRSAKADATTPASQQKGGYPLSSISPYTLHHTDYNARA